MGHQWLGGSLVLRVQVLLIYLGDLTMATARSLNYLADMIISTRR